MALRPVRGMALCAGGGGLELGLSLALGDAYRTICYVEREVYAASILVSRMEEGRLHPAPVWDDLTTFDGRRWRGCVDLLSAGFPCQPFSAAGKRQADDDSRHLWPHVRRAINGARPPLVFLENVSAIVSTRQADGRPAYMVVRNELERLGYRVTETLVRASDVGAPHQRERIFILAHHRSAGPQDTEQERQPTRPTPEFRGPMADAERAQWRASHGPGGCHRQGGYGQRQAAGRTGERGETLADAQRAATRGISGELDGTPGTGEGEGQERERVWGAARHARAAFPPGPGDTDAWHAILAERPELAPALGHATGGSARTSRAGGETWGATKGDAAQPVVRGMADGVARALEHRTQRLRLLGNGVVPLAAAVAFDLCATNLTRRRQT
jgi:DNA (cytosine-5)-methyltransferase 1